MRNKSITNIRPETSFMKSEKSIRVEFGLEREYKGRQTAAFIYCFYVSTCGCCEFSNWTAALEPSYQAFLRHSPTCYNSVALTIVPYDQIIHHCKTILRLISFYIPVWQNNLELWKLWSHSLWAVSRFLVYENFMSLYENFMSLYEKN